MSVHHLSWRMNPQEIVIYLCPSRSIKCLSRPSRKGSFARQITYWSCSLVYQSPLFTDTLTERCPEAHDLHSFGPSCWFVGPIRFAKIFFHRESSTSARFQPKQGRFRAKGNSPLTNCLEPNSRSFSGVWLDNMFYFSLNANRKWFLSFLLGCWCLIRSGIKHV